MNKVIEGAYPLEDLEMEMAMTDRSVKQLQSWKNHSPNIDFHAVTLILGGNEYYVEVDFGLTSGIWCITRSERNQLLRKDNIREIAEFLDDMASEPIIDRSGEV